MARFSKSSNLSRPWSSIQRNLKKTIGLDSNKYEANASSKPEGMLQSKHKRKNGRANSQDTSGYKKLP